MPFPLPRLGLALRMRLLLSFCALAWIGLYGAACTADLPLPKPTATPSQPATQAPPTFTPPLPPTATPTPLRPRAVLLAPQGADPSLIEAAGAALSNLSAQTGLLWELRPALSAGDLTPDVRLVVALFPASDLEVLAQAAPSVQFLAVNIPALPAYPNLSRIGPEGGGPEQAAFLAGVVAAIITDEWRVGVISLADTSDGLAARQAFLNGVVFFCGLCRQVHPPYYKYPLYAEYPFGASEAEKLAAVEALVDRYVKTVYLYPGANDVAVVKALVEAGVSVIGGAVLGEPPPAQWAATIRANPAEAFTALLPELMQGKGGAIVPMPLEMTDINPELFSPGRQALAQKYLQEIVLGVIAIGDLLE